MMKLDLEAARKELKEKSENEIEEETARKWAARAIVCYEKCIEDSSVEMFSRGDDNYHEALEHAALSENTGLVSEVKSEIAEKRKKCLAKISKTAGTSFLSLRQSRIIKS